MEYLYFVKHNTKHGYFILLQSDAYCEHIISDKDIADFLGISKKKYQNILKQFNSILLNSSLGIFFIEEEDCENAIDYLHEITESCLIIKELMGG